MGNSPGAMLHKNSISKGNSIPRLPPLPRPHPHPSPAPHPWAVSHAQIDTGLTQDLCRHSPTARSRAGHQNLQKCSNLKLKKGMIGRLMLTTLDLCEGRGRRHDVIYIESIKVDP
jgi:hypothetical protein